MADGYFNDGTVNIELGEHVFVTPFGRRRNVILELHDDPASVLASGGGALELDVRAQRVRDNLGDAERYIYEYLHSLATSDPGDLGHEDNRGHHSVFGDSVCVGAEGVVSANQFADMRLAFESPEKSSEPAWGSVPAAPATYAGTSTLQDYAAGGVNLGVGGLMGIEMQRSWPLREIPRARGARTTMPPRGAAMRFIVTAARVAGTANLAADLEGLMRSIGPGKMDLTGNGNTFEDVLLQAMRPAHTDHKHTMVEFVFVKQI